MAEKLGDVFVEVRSDVKALRKDMNTIKNDMNRKTKKMGETAKKNIIPAWLRIGAVILAAKKAWDFTVELKNAARDAQETGNKFNTVFSSMTRRANAMADSFATSFGLAGSTARELLGNTGDLLVGFGFTEKKALSLANQVNALAVDLASFTNFSGGAAGASAALTKALLGERESVKSLGISILEVDVKKQILIDRSNGLTFATERQAKAQATLTIAMRQSGKAIGDYARTKNDLANIERRVDEQLKTQMETIGKGLLPAFVGLNKAMSGWMTLYIEFLGVAQKEQPLNVKMLDDYANSLKNIDWRRIAKEEKEAFIILEASNKKVDELQEKIDFLEIGRQGILTGNQEAELKLLKERIKIEEFNNRILLERHRIVTDIQATGRSEFGDDSAIEGKIQSVRDLLIEQEAINNSLFKENELRKRIAKELAADTLGFKDIEGKGAERLETEAGFTTPESLEERGEQFLPFKNPDLDPDKFQADLGIMESSYNNFWTNLADTSTTFSEKLKNVWSILASSFSQMVGDIVKEWIVGLFAQQAASKASEVAAVASAQVTGRAVAAAWSTAASMASIATFGGAAVAGTAALATGVASAKGLATARDGGSFSGGKKVSNFIVPSGHPTDTFPVLVKSGERLDVTPVGAASNQDKALANISKSLNNMSMNQKALIVNINANLDTLTFTQDETNPNQEKLNREVSYDV